MKISEDKCLEILHALIAFVDGSSSENGRTQWKGHVDTDLAKAFNANGFKHIEVVVVKKARGLCYEFLLKGIKIEKLIDWFIKNLPDDENLLMAFTGHFGWDIRKHKKGVMFFIEERLSGAKHDFIIFFISDMKIIKHKYPTGEFWYDPKTKTFRITLYEQDRKHLLDKSNILFKLMHFAMKLG